MEERLLSLLKLAVKYNATDIHFNCINKNCDIDMRVNGSLKKVKTKFGDYRLIRYLQYLANLDVGNILKPQTGQFEMEVEGESLSLRFALINVNNLSNGVLRILNNNNEINVDNLSLIKEQNEFFKSLLHKDSGLVLFSGPTGSGKTTTLYSLLKSVPDLKIYTIEDPIEMYIDNFIQLSVNESVGFDYSAGIKQILRHDPDIIMIGEIRDEKAAKMAVVAANTGHLVLSTIHASRAYSCISRMSELGVNEEHLYEDLLCLVNQRLLTNELDKTKNCLYEIMDKKEIEYYRLNKHNSKDFLSLESQIRKGVTNGYYKQDSF